MKTTLQSIFLYLTAMLLPYLLNAQTLQWAKALSGPGDEIGYSVTVDAEGNVYTTGSFGGTVDFDPGPGSANISSLGNEDIFISKLDDNGNHLWTKTMGGTSSFSYGLNIAVDDAGNIYCSGLFFGTVDFDPGPGAFSMTAQGVDLVLFILKLDANGDFVWAKTMGGVDAASSNISHALDSWGNIFMTGNFAGTVDFDPGLGTSNLTSNGKTDIFISKLDNDGNFVWAKSIGGSYNDQSTSITVDNSSNVFITGNFVGSIDFDPGPGITELLGPGAYILKLDTNGNFVWVRQLGGLIVSTKDIEIDMYGNLYGIGSFGITIDFGPGAGIANLTPSGDLNTFIIKLDNNGNYLWAKSLDGDNYSISPSIALDAQGNVYSTGHFSGTINFDAGLDTVNIISIGSFDVFISKFDTDGNYVWAKSFGGTGESNDNRSSSIAVDKTGNAYVTGYFKGVVEFEPGLGIADLISEGENDISIYKMYDGSTSIDLDEAISSFVVYPNPTQGAVTFTMPDVPLGQTLRLTNAMGQVVASYEVIGTSLEVDLNHVPSGVYFFQLQSPKEVVTQKIVKQ